MTLNLLVASKDSHLVHKIKDTLDLNNIHFNNMTNGNDLLLTVLDNKYDLLILDNQLDEIFGYDGTPIIKKARPKLSIIYLDEKDEYYLSRKIASSGVIIRLIKSNDLSFFQNIKKIVERCITKGRSERREFITND